MTQDSVTKDRLNLLFDRAWYIDQYPEVAASGVDPLDHYLSVGAAHGLDPHPLFDTSFYVEQYPDVANGGDNPLEHFLTHGRTERRYPHLLFDTPWYLEHYPEVAAAGINPLVEYLTDGAVAGRDPNPSFNTRVYLERHPELKSSGINPLVHYVLSGGAAERDPTRLRIQVHRARGIGDVLLITPILAALRKRHPNAEIVVTTEFPELLWNNPHIDAVYRLPKLLHDFDVTFE